MKTWLKIVLTVLVFLLIGFYGAFNLYPCKTAPVVLNPIYTWNLCSMDLIAAVQIVGIDKLYFGLTWGRWIAILLNLVLAYLIVLGADYLYNKFKK